MQDEVLRTEKRRAPSPLTGRAPVGQPRIGAPLVDLHCRPAPAARLTGAAVDPQAFTWIVAAGRAPVAGVGGHWCQRRMDVGEEQASYRGDKASQTIGLEIASLDEWIDTARKQHFGLVDVPDPCDDSLVQQDV